MATKKSEPIKLTGHLEKRKAGSPFAVELSDGQVFTIPDVKTLSPRTLWSLEGLSEEAALTALMGAEQAEAFLSHEDVDLYFMEDFMESWRQHAGLPGGSGESPASST